MANDKLIEFRISEKMTHGEFAKEIGISKSYYEKIEYGDRKPSYNFLSKFTNRFPYAEVNKIFFEFGAHETCENESELVKKEE